MQYNSTNELLYNYREALDTLKINTSIVPFLDLNIYNPKEDEQKIMRLLITIADILEFDLAAINWFHIENDAQPFNNISPYNYIIKNKYKGLLETVFYLKALTVSETLWASQMKGELLAKEALLQVKVPPLPRPPNLPEATD